MINILVLRSTLYLWIWFSKAIWLLFSKESCHIFQLLNLEYFPMYIFTLASVFPSYNIHLLHDCEGNIKSYFPVKTLHLPERSCNKLFIIPNDRWWFEMDRFLIVFHSSKAITYWILTGFYDNREICNGYMPKHLSVKKNQRVSKPIGAKNCMIFFFTQKRLAYIAFKTIPSISLFDLSETLPESNFERHQYCNHIMPLFAQLPVFPA